MPTPLAFTRMTTNVAQQILAWRYPAPYDSYNTTPAEAELGIAVLIDPANNYYVIAGKDDAVVAFCCFGDDAQVNGGDYHAQAVDIGLGLRPDLTGAGNGSIYFAAICAFAQRRWQPTLLRLTVATFNQRALRLYEKAGFQRDQAFQRASDGMKFYVLTKPTGEIEKPGADAQA